MKKLVLLLAFLHINCNAFNLFNREIVLEVKLCSVEPCIEAIFTYSINNNKIIQKIQLLDNKRKIVRAEVKALDDCQIIDDKNWNCHASNRDMMISVVDGIYYPQASSAKYMTYKQIK